MTTRKPWMPWHEGVYCRSCNFDLRATEGEHCPECGTEFDITDVDSYRHWPVRGRTWVLSYLCAVPLGMAVTAVLHGVDHLDVTAIGTLLYAIIIMPLIVFGYARRRISRS